MRLPLGMLGGLLAAGALAGCGGKAKDENYEPPAVAQNTPEPPKTTPEPPKKDEPKLEPPKKDEPKGPAKPPDVPPPFTLQPPPPPLVPQPDPPPMALPMPKDPPPTTGQPAPKEQPKFDPNKPFEWPLSIYGRPMSEYIRDIDDTDPAIREQGLRTLPNFGPNARKAGIKVVLKRMNPQFEKDPGVRAAAFEAIGAFALFSPDGIVESETDTSEAIRILLAALNATSPSGGATRLHAITTIGNFGPRAASTINTLVGQNMTTMEPAYETRRALATTLGAISFVKDNGPSARTIKCLTDVMITDDSAAVRLAAYQSIVMLGPVYLPPTKDANGKTVLKVDEATTATHVKAIKARLQPFKVEPGGKHRESVTGLIERDKQVEIFARLALMRLDVKEQTEENMNGIAKYATQGGDSGPKIQALQALTFMGPGAARKINDVCKALDDDDPQVVVAAATCLVSMGVEGKPAIEFLEKMKTRGNNKEEKEQFSMLADRAIKAIKEAKPFLPKP